MAPDGWSRRNISNLIEDHVLYIGDGYRAKNSELSSCGIPFAHAGNINGGFNFEVADRFPEKDLGKVGIKLSRPGDVVFTSKGTVGRFAFVRDDTQTFVYSPQLSFWRSLDHDIIHPRFLYYWMFGSEFLHQYSGVKGQTDMADYVSLRDQRQMFITLPPLDEQREIAHILGTLDDKIELNRRMNATLEAIARAIFKSWFVDFDPVHAKARGEQPYGMDADTAALFPDAFEDSELGPIPAGWGVGALSNIADNPRRGIKPEAMDSNTLYIGLEHMPQKSITLDAWGRTSNVASNKFKFRKGEFLFGKLRPYFHKVGIAPDDGVCSTDILVIVPTFEAWYGLTLFHISSKEFIDYTTAASTGTRMPRTNWDTMSKYPIVIPDPKVAEAFSCFLRPLLDTIQNNIWQSRTLAALRDALLPKLISGELRTKELHHVPSTGTG